MNPTEQEIYEGWEKLGDAVAGAFADMPDHVVRWFAEHASYNAFVQNLAANTNLWVEVEAAENATETNLAWMEKLKD